MHHVKEASWPPIVVPVVKSARCNQSTRWCTGCNKRAVHLYSYLGWGGGGGGGSKLHMKNEQLYGVSFHFYL